MEPGSSGPPAEPTNAKRLQQVRILYDQMRQKADCLEQEVKNLKKGKQPGRDPLRCTGPRTDCYSLPRPDNYEGPPLSGPSGMYAHDRLPPISEVKPILMDKPEHFEGAHDNIKHFIGDCVTYFKVFRRHYMQHPAFMVVFTMSLFRGAAKDWWVHLHNEYKYHPDEEEEDEEDEDAPFNGGPCYHFPTWEEFTRLVCEQFHDPTIELVHERKMGEIKMTGPAYLFF